MRKISADRYYAVHLFGDLKDVRVKAVAILITSIERPRGPLYRALGAQRDRRKGRRPHPIMLMLTDKNPDMRVLAIDALERLRAKGSLPQLRLLLGHDDQRIHFDGLGNTVAEAARAAIAKLEAMP